MRTFLLNDDTFRKRALRAVVGLDSTQETRVTEKRVLTGGDTERRGIFLQLLKTQIHCEFRFFIIILWKILLISVEYDDVIFHYFPSLVPLVKCFTHLCGGGTI